MTESEVRAIALQYVCDNGLKHDGISHTHYVPLDDPLYLRDRESDIWLVFFSIPKCEGWERFDMDCFLVEVDCGTQNARLIPSI